MEVNRDDGRVQMRRCLEALATTADKETRIALWKAAVRFSRKQLEPDRRLEIETAGLPRAGGAVARDGM